ncbi:leucyl aminopeptidase family protein [Wenzhouxiangella marina]|uniref:Leucyl aminopeptidase n=1 Tax=Wenzhouxiangella marina TaxID=1579979 RepID=A0A0K0XYW2_9GAMM|nr:leucyl aminopeptidase family protein [Wenzhouxiangella marina]AKS42860.1 leucyl aminopeptidase [Wenzhouxiangella marina]MBB6087458.1 leucyl aminopeptidase [Wenzhouxiangella marina]
MFCSPNDDCVPLELLSEDQLDAWLQGASARTRRWVEGSGFQARADSFVPIPDEQGGLAAVLAGRASKERLWALAHLPARLPAGHYRLVGDWSDEDLELLLLGWALGAYRFDRYKETSRPEARLALPEKASRRVTSLYEASAWVRDLVNTPASDLGPAELAAEAQGLAERFEASLEVIEGDRLEQEFPAIHAVGQASARAPRLIRMRWGDPGNPALALVGKGVVFDSGGLDIKPGAGMVLMKKDMGGAAHVLGLARLIMDLGLKVDLRVYIPAVENSISGNAYRPSDVVRTRKGSTVEIGNTDAEGRVVLSDALTLACEEGAERVIDFATLTGAARIALGEDLPPIYARKLDQARAIQDRSFELQDPLWQLPLFEGYRSQIQPAIADLSNTGTSPFGGSLTAALFLDHFVDEDRDWMHLDIYAWNRSDRPGRPAGGEAQGLRAIFDWLEREYGRS